MGRWILIAMSTLLLSVTGAETLVGAFADATQCSDDASCPPFSDDCNDCAQCMHPRALTAVSIAVALSLSPRSSDPAPLGGPSRAPRDVPAREILTVPRA